MLDDLVASVPAQIAAAPCTSVRFVIEWSARRTSSSSASSSATKAEHASWPTMRSKSTATVRQAADDVLVERRNENPSQRARARTKVVTQLKSACARRRKLEVCERTSQAFSTPCDARVVRGTAVRRATAVTEPRESGDDTLPAGRSLADYAAGVA